MAAEAQQSTPRPSYYRKKKVAPISELRVNKNNINLRDVKGGQEIIGMHDASNHAHLQLRIGVEKILKLVYSDAKRLQLLDEGAKASHFPIAFGEKQQAGQCTLVSVPANVLTFMSNFYKIRPFHLAAFSLKPDKSGRDVYSLGFAKLSSDDLMKDGTVIECSSWCEHIQVESYVLEDLAPATFGKKQGIQDEPFFATKVTVTRKDLQEIIEYGMHGTSISKTFKPVIAPKHLIERQNNRPFLEWKGDQLAPPIADDLTPRSAPGIRGSSGQRQVDQNRVLSQYNYAERYLSLQIDTSRWLLAGCGTSDASQGCIIFQDAVSIHLFYMMDVLQI